MNGRWIARSTSDGNCVSERPGKFTAAVACGSMKIEPELSTGSSATNVALSISSAVNVMLSTIGSDVGMCRKWSAAMRIDGWWWRDTFGYDDWPLYCIACGRDVSDFDFSYSARSPSDDQVAAVRLIFDVDVFSDFDVCQQCVADTPFDEWLEERLTARLKAAINTAPHDWAREGF